jgi:CRP-like cAMP-binding protein
MRHAIAHSSANFVVITSYPVILDRQLFRACRRLAYARDKAKPQPPKSFGNATFLGGHVFTHPPNHNGNKLLASLPLDEYQRIVPHLRSVPMKIKQLVHKQDQPIDDVVFPNGGILSLVKTLQDGQVAEVASVGAEGAVGASVFFGQQLADCNVIVQLAGPGAHAMSADVFKAEMEKRGSFFNHVVRYNQALMSQIMQTTACNGLHSAEQRCCRWLLMTSDRAGSDEFPMTHELLATMLGVRRPTVTLVAANLQQAGLIQYRRGSVKILDRQKLENASCECYRTVKDQMRRLLPDVQAPLS